MKPSLIIQNTWLPYTIIQDTNFSKYLKVENIGCCIVCNYLEDKLTSLVWEVVAVWWEAVVCFFGRSCLIGGSTFAVVVHEGRSKDQVVYS